MPIVTNVMSYSRVEVKYYFSYSKILLILGYYPRVGDKSTYF